MTPDQITRRWRNELLEGFKKQLDEEWAKTGGPPQDHSAIAYRMLLASDFSVEQTRDGQFLLTATPNVARYFQLLEAEISK